MSTLPTEIGTGWIHGRFIVAVTDGSDTDQEPDAIPAQGSVRFNASIGYNLAPSVTGGPVTIINGPIVGVFDDEGYLCTPNPFTGEPMYRGVKLTATDDSDLAVVDWTWTATYQFGAVGGITPSVPAHSFAVPTDSSQDLATLASVPSSPGYGLPQAEAAVLRAESAAVSAEQSAVEALAAALRAEQVAGATDAGVALLLGDAGTESGGLLSGMLAPKADIDAMNNALASKADEAALAAGLAGKADNAALVSGLATKADQSALISGLATKAEASDLAGKADLVAGKVPVAQLPTDALVTDANVAAQINGAQTGPAIDARINTQVTPTVEQIAADYIASQPAVVDAAAAAVDANPTIADLQTGKSDVGHTHTQIEQGPGTVRVNSVGGVQHIVNGTTVAEFNPLGQMTRGKVRQLSRTETPALLVLSDAGQLQFWNAAGDRVMTFNDSGVMSAGIVESIRQALSSASLRFDSAGQLQYLNASGELAVKFNSAGEMIAGTVPWGNVTGVPEELNVSDTDGPLGPLTALLSHANTRTVPLFFIGSSTTGRAAYPTGVTKRLAAAYPSGGAEYGTVSARNPLTATHAGPGVAGYNGGIGGTNSANYLTTDVLNNIALTQPVAVFHGIGSNDWAASVDPATYEANVRASIASIDAVLTKPHVHILMQQQTRHGTRTYAWDEYSAAMRRIADDAGNRVFIDLGPAIDTTDPFGADPFGFGEGDGTHLNAAGEDVLGELMARALGVPGGAGRRGYTIDQSAGRVVKVWDYLNNREQMIYGDTGVRDITSLCAEATFGASGSVLLVRTGSDVHLYINELTSHVPGEDLDVDLISLPNGFRPPGDAFTVSFTGNSPNGRVLISRFGGVVLYNMPEGRTVNCTAHWTTTNPWPTSLLGTAVGTIPNL